MTGWPFENAEQEVCYADRTNSRGEMTMAPEQQAQFISSLGGLSQLVVVSIILERGLAFIFEHDWFRMAFTRPVPGSADPNARETLIPGLRGTLALIAALVICFMYKLDVLSALFGSPADWLGIAITGVVAAGGSAGAIAVFQGFLNFNRDTREALIAAKKAEAQAAAEIAKADAEAKKVAAEAEKVKAEATKAAAEASKAISEAEKVQAEARKKQAEVDSATLGQGTTQPTGTGTQPQGPPM